MVKRMRQPASLGASSAARSLVRRQSNVYLIETVAPASSSSFLSFSASSFEMPSLTLAGNAFDQILGFLQAQAGGGADDLDHADLLVAEAFEDDVELGLLFGRRRPRRRRRPGRPSSRRRRRPA